MRIVHTLIGLLILSGNISAQQAMLYTQYFANGFVVNPALAGSDGTLKFQLTARDYMIGISESPKTFTISCNGRLLGQRSGARDAKMGSQIGKIGMGGLIYNDHNGLVNRLGLQCSYAYHLELNQSQLSLGLSASLSQTSIDVDKLDFHDPEPMLREGFGNVVYAPDAALGVFYKNREHFLGLTVSNLFQRSVHFGEIDYKLVYHRHFYLLGGTSFDIGDNSYIAPSFLLKVASNRMYQNEFSVRVSHKDDVWMAFTYRTPQVVALMFGTSIHNFIIAYTYEYNFSALRSFSLGAHEVCLIYRIGDTSRRSRWLVRY